MGSSQNFINVDPSEASGYAWAMSDATSYLNAVKAFEAAARHESFAKAAAELCVSHTVVSRHIRNLEAWLETRLFERKGNRVVLTRDARMIAPKISAAFLSINECFDGLRSTRPKRHLRVGAEPAFATKWLRRRINGFLAEFPDVEIDIVALRRPTNVHGSETDAVIHFDRRLPAKVTAEHRLFPIDGYPACSPELFRTHGREGAAPEFPGLPLVHDHGHEIWREWFMQYAPGSDAWRHGRVYSDLSLAVDAAVDGEGVILADDILCAKEIQTGALVKVDGRILRCAWYCAVFNEATVSFPVVKAFRSWLNAQVV
jgi:LysR family transcriptional regulator, glycine cleavage system transcriptional activator